MTRTACKAEAQASRKYAALQAKWKSALDRIQKSNHEDGPGGVFDFVLIEELEKAERRAAQRYGDYSGGPLNDIHGDS